MPNVLSSSPARTRAEQARALVADLLGEPVDAAVECTYPGQFGALLAFQAVPLLGIFLRAKGKRRSRGLPQQFVLAVAGDRVIALGQPKMNWNVKTVKITKPLLEMSLSAGVVVTTRRPAAGLEVELTFGDGQAFAAHAVDRRAGERLAAAIEVAAGR